MYEVSKELSFSSAHQVRFAAGGCEALHGHNYRVRIHARAPRLDATGYVVDFAVLEEAARSIIDRLDHRHLNEVPPFDVQNPTAENIARHLGEALAARLDDGRIEIYRVEVWESAASRAAWSRD